MNPLRKSPKAGWVRIDGRTFSGDTVSDSLSRPSDVSLNPPTSGNVSSMTAAIPAKVIERDTAGSASVGTLALPSSVVVKETVGDGAASSLAPRSSVIEGTGMQGNVAAPSLAPLSQGAEGGDTQGNSLAPSSTSSQGQHLKPDYRWEMPLPRNLLSYPESFDPANTGWAFSNAKYGGTVDNVGPNGEAAARFDAGFAPYSNFSNTQFGVHSHYLIRTVSGSGDVRIKLNIDNGGNVDKYITIDTNWVWVGLNAAPLSSDEEYYITRIIDDTAGAIYCLRAGVNYGSTLHYTTDQSVEQTIPEVIQGADLTNGSSSGVDTTSDLDFGVDGSGVPYAVSDGDDLTEDIPSSALGGSWAARIYLRSENFVTYLGDRVDGRWDFQKGSSGEAFVRLEDVNGNSYFPNVSTGINEDGWNTVVITLDEGTNTIRLNINGNTESVTTTADFKDSTFPLVNVEASGGRVEHIEKHPVLTEAEAEAVRQRLAQNPTDPVPPTEAWDLSAETSPHNHIKHSQDPSQWNATGSPVLTQSSNSPVGDGTSYIIEDDDSNDFKNLETERVYFDSGVKETLVAYIKKKRTGSNNMRVFRNFNSGGNVLVYFDPVSGEYAKSDGDGGANLTVTIVDTGGWWIVSVRYTVDGANSDVIQITPAANESTPVDTTSDSTATGTVEVGGLQIVRGHQVVPPYAQTDSSIAYPQTVPALRDSTNDLTLGTETNNNGEPIADSADPAWVAPIGLVGDGSDDKITVPSFHNNHQVTWVVRRQTKENGGRIGSATANGWRMYIDSSGGPLIRCKDVNGNTVETIGTGNFNDLQQHVFALVLDRSQETFTVYVDDTLGANATLDISSLGALVEGPFPLFVFEFGALRGTHAHVYTRALSDEEALYARQAIIDNPDDPFSNYTNP